MITLVFAKGWVLIDMAMKLILYYVLMSFTIFISPALSQSEIDIPEFTPNVVSLESSLTSSDVQKINQTIAEVSKKSGILAAVFVAPTIGDESIESVAVRAFKKWQLGEQGKDNGLLLVIALKERRSRIEVGYGLEDVLTDAVCKRVLDEVLRPFMVSGDMASAVVFTLNSLADIKLGEGAASQGLDGHPIEAFKFENFYTDLRLRNGLVVFIIYVLLIWLLNPISKVFNLYFATKLAANYPTYRVEKDRLVNYGKIGPRLFLQFDRPIYKTVFVRAFFSLNPGIFIFAISNINIFVCVAELMIMLFVTIVYLRIQSRRYSSIAEFEKFAIYQKNDFSGLVARKHAIEVAYGLYEYTPEYYKSEEYRRSRSSSSSGSSRRSGGGSSSSSRGGRSGGGGASSSW